jgi:hypothetical protein
LLSSKEKNKSLAIAVPAPYHKNIMVKNGSKISSANEEKYLEGIRRLSAGDKIRIASELSELSRELSRTGIRLRNPGLSEPEVEKELWRIIDESRRSSPFHNKNT